MRLDELSIGQKATILKLTHEGSRLTRLLEMGLFEGVSVTLVRRAPMGDPLELKLGDYNLSLRAEDARLVEVAP